MQTVHNRHKLAELKWFWLTKTKTDGNFLCENSIFLPNSWNCLFSTRKFQTTFYIYHKTMASMWLSLGNEKKNKTKEALNFWLDEILHTERMKPPRPPIPKTEGLLKEEVMQDGGNYCCKSVSVHQNVQLVKCLWHQTMNYCILCTTPVTEFSITLLVLLSLLYINKN